MRVHYLLLKFPARIFDSLQFVGSLHSCCFRLRKLLAERVLLLPAFRNDSAQTLSLASLFFKLRFQFLSIGAHFCGESLEL